MKKQIQVHIEFSGSDKLQEVGPGSFRGGVPAPKLDDKLGFALFRCERDENNIFNPVDGEGAVEGAFQLNVFGTSEGYRALAAYLLSLAELDTTADEGFHIHHDGVKSLDDNTRVDVILRKSEQFPSK